MSKTKQNYNKILIQICNHLLLSVLTVKYDHITQWFGCQLLQIAIYTLEEKFNFID